MISIVVASLVALAVLFFGVRLIGQERAKARDSQRVADIPPAGWLSVAFQPDVELCPCGCKRLRRGEEACSNVQPQPGTCRVLPRSVIHAVVITW